ncbi:MAG: Hsp20/alpha crystallin family protein [Pirellulales bacterium]|nr:Hsp20/alpha crystallin family protein [Pirellulales bacterium]
MVFRYRNTRHPMHQLRDEMDRLLTGFLGQPSGGPWPGVGRGHPAVNLWEDADAMIVELEVPGVKKDQIDISVVGDELSLKIERPDPTPEDVTYHRRERPVGAFGRVLRLPADVDAGRVEAELSDGVLTITLPKAENAKPRKIEVVSA